MAWQVDRERLTVTPVKRQRSRTGSRYVFRSGVLAEATTQGQEPFREGWALSPLTPFIRLSLGSQCSGEFSVSGVDIPEWRESVLPLPPSTPRPHVPSRPLPPLLPDPPTPPTTTPTRRGWQTEVTATTVRTCALFCSAPQRMSLFCPLSFSKFL